MALTIISEKERRAEQRSNRYYGPPKAIMPYWAGRLEHMLGTRRDQNPCDPDGHWRARWDQGWRDFEESPSSWVVSQFEFRS